MEKLTKNEEKLLKNWEVTNKKLYKRILPLIVIGLVLLVIFDLYIGVKLYNSEPIKSRDHFWFAAMFASWGILIFSWYMAARRFLAIIQKLRKR
jgi:hypothetical protein